MKARKEAVDLILKQFMDEKESLKGGNWHYGRQELRALLDFIYEGRPDKEEDEIKSFEDMLKIRNQINELNKG